jgi:hypothetical protein
MIGLAIAGDPENDGHLSPWQEAGIVAPSVMLRKLAAYRRQEPARPRAPGAGADRTHAVHARLARKPGIAPTLPCRAQQERAGLFPRAGHLHLQTRPANKAGKQGRIAERSAEAQQFRASASTSSSPQSCSGTPPTSPLNWELISFSGDFQWERAAATADKRRPLNLGQTRVAS